LLGELLLSKLAAIDPDGEAERPVGWMRGIPALFSGASY